MDDEVTWGLNEVSHDKMAMLLLATACFTMKGLNQAEERHKSWPQPQLLKSARFVTLGVPEAGLFIGFVGFCFRLRGTNHEGPELILFWFGLAWCQSLNVEKGNLFKTGLVGLGAEGSGSVLVCVFQNENPTNGGFPLVATPGRLP